MKQSAIITGITGQDGSYLAEYLLERDIEVYGGIRKNSSSPSNMGRISHLLDHPNYRKFHENSTPIVGGLAIVITFFIILNP